MKAAGRPAGVPWLAWTCVGALFLLLSLSNIGPEGGILRRLGIHRGLRRGTIGYVRLLNDAGPLLPPVIHATVEAEDMLPGRLIVIGDVHGCLDELHELLDRVEYSQGNDTLIFAGDLVDKGPFSVEVVRSVRRLGGLSVRGNHDDAGLAAFEGWQQGGGLKRKHKWVKELGHKNAAFLYHMPFSIHLPTHSMAIVHAGVIPDLDMEHQSLWNLYQMRGLIERRHGQWIATDSKSPRHIPWASQYGGPDHIVFGHDSRKGLQDEKYATGLDTGCVSGGRLTAAVFPPPAEMRHRKKDWPGADCPVTLDMLGGQLASVPSRQDYAAEEDHCAVESLLQLLHLA